MKDHAVLHAAWPKPVATPFAFLTKRCPRSGTRGHVIAGRRILGRCTGMSPIEHSGAGNAL